MRKTLLVLLAVVTLVGAACGDDDDTTAGGTGGQGAPSGEVTVDVDRKSDDVDLFTLGYFPGTVRAHPGDTLVYESNFTGEPHTVTFGTVVTDAIEAFRSMTPEQLESDGPPPPAFQKLEPLAMLPEGPGDARQVSVNPCFIVSGDLPADPSKPCEVRTAPAFTGKETFYNSGFLPDEATFELKLADDIAPGTYEAFCMLHFVEMVSTIEVVPEDQDATTAEEAEEAADTEFSTLEAKAEEGLAKAEAFVKPGQILAGDAPGGEEEAPDGPPKANTVAGLATFVPADLDVKAGDTISLIFNGPHTFTFNATEDVRTFLTKAPDGTFHVVEKALTPAVFDVPPPPEEEPEGPPPPVDIGSWDGTGFANTGIQFGGTFNLKITRAGTYEYICAIHPDMEGSITVT